MSPLSEPEILPHQAESENMASAGTGLSVHPTRPTTLETDDATLTGSARYTAVAQHSGHVAVPFEMPSDCKFGSAAKDKNLATDGAPDSWASLAALFYDYDQKTVEGWNGQLDALLVFLGIFASVVSSFTIEFYKLLQSDGTAQSSPSPTRFAVVLNSLWFSSLVISLVAASLLILQKQWLRKYANPELGTPQGQARIRYHRHKAVKEWMILDIMDVLSFLVRISLLLFLIGTAIFLWPLNTIVAAVVIVLVGTWALVYFTSFLLPVFNDTCPYRSSEAFLIDTIVGLILPTRWRLKKRIEEIAKNTAHGSPRVRDEERTRSWMYVEETLMDCPTYDSKVLVAACQLFMDTGSYEPLRGCARDLNWSAFDFAAEVLFKGLRATFDPNKPKWFQNTLESFDIKERIFNMTGQSAKLLVLIVIDCLVRALEKYLQVDRSQGEPPEEADFIGQCSLFITSVVTALPKRHDSEEIKKALRHTIMLLSLRIRGGLLSKDLHRPKDSKVSDVECRALVSFLRMGLYSKSDMRNIIDSSALPKICGWFNKPEVRSELDVFDMMWVIWSLADNHPDKSQLWGDDEFDSFSIWSEQQAPFLHLEVPLSMPEDEALQKFDDFIDTSRRAMTFNSTLCSEFEKGKSNYIDQQ